MTRTITMLKERQVLPCGTVIRDTAGVAWVRHRASWKATTPIKDDQWIEMPATVLHEPPTPAPAPSVVPEAAVEAFKAAWHKADDEGRGGERVRDGLTAALPLLTAAPSATRDEVARLIDPSGWRYFDTGMFPPDHPASTGVVHNSRETADALLARFNITPKEDR